MAPDGGYNDVDETAEIDTYRDAGPGGVARAPGTGAEPNGRPSPG
jgi:hypothetical protein